MENKQSQDPQNTSPASLLSVVIEALENAKAQNITSLDVSHLTAVTDYLAICNGTSSRHLKTIAETAMEAVRKAGFDVLGHEGNGTSEWVVVDLGDVVLHVMSPEARRFYHLEGLWDIDASSEAGAEKTGNPAS